MIKKGKDKSVTSTRKVENGAKGEEVVNSRKAGSRIRKIRGLRTRGKEGGDGRNEAMCGLGIADIARYVYTPCMDGGWGLHTCCHAEKARRRGTARQDKRVQALTPNGCVSSPR
jgi:hypothetical protein